MSAWRGLDQAIRSLRRLKGDARRMMRSAVRAEAEEIMTDIKHSEPGKGVPKDTGALRDTGQVDGPSSDPLPQVTLSFGGPAAPYALVQHEDHTLHHDLGESRYLVRGVERRAMNGEASEGLAEKLRSLKGVT